MRPLIASFKNVFSRPPYIVLSIGGFAAMLVLAIWLPNLSLIGNTLVSSTLTVTQKARFLIASLGALETNFTALSRLITIAVALLFGLHISIAVYYFKLRANLQRTGVAGTSGLGMIAGLLGVGCASCGSIILSSIFGAGATLGFIGLFPLRGLEFGILGIAMLGLSIVLTARKIQQPLACATKSD